MINVKRSLVAALAAAALGMAAAPAAHANSADDNYLNTLASRGITGQPDQLIAAGHAVCDNTSNAGGGNIGGAASMFSVMTSLGFGPQQAYFLQSAAYNAYCPQYHVPLAVG
jgi:hypothetical protein